MVRILIFLLFLIFFVSCNNNKTEFSTQNILQNEYLNVEDDSLKFLVYGLNPFLPIDSVIWIKIDDNSNKRNSRKISYQILSRKGVPELRNFIIEPSSLKTSTNQGNYYLSVYKSYLMTNDTLNKLYFERDETGKYTRFFNSSLVQIKTEYFNGPAIWTYLEYFDMINDSIGRKTYVDEYYISQKGLVKIVKTELYYCNGSFKNQSLIYSYKVP